MSSLADIVRVFVDCPALDEKALYLRLALALGVGFLIGLQRQQSAPRDEDGHSHSLGGVRTYPLVALMGALSVLLAKSLGAWVFGAAFVAVLAPMAISYVQDVRSDRDRGITSEIAFVLTLMLGAACVVGDGAVPMLLIAGTSVAVLALLSFKEPLHGFAARLSSEDIFATVKFAVLAVIVLPLLPNKGYGPGGALNPRTIGLLIVLIAGTSFVGYVAIRAMGPGRGLGITGLAGGLVSSTAVTLAFSGRAKREPAVAAACALGVVLASTIMFPRVLVTVAVVNRALVQPLAIPLGAAMLAGLIAAAILYWHARKAAAATEQIKLSNPFELGGAIKFGLIFAVVLVLSQLLRKSEAGVYLIAVVAGSTDVDTITLAAARLMGQGELTAEQASTAILIGAGANTLVKGGMAVLLGGWAFGKRVLAAFAAMLVAGGAGLALLWLG